MVQLHGPVPSSVVSASGAAEMMQQIFGARVPADYEQALTLLAESPLAPASAAELQAVREAVLTAVTARLEEKRPKDAASVPASSTTGKPLGGAVALRLAELTKAKAAAADPSAGLTRALTPARAQELFDAIAAAKDIPHGFVDEGCHFRAHAVAKRLEEQGVYSEKVFLHPSAGDLRIDSSKAALGYTIAMFHAATAVFVKTEKGFERRVIDPSLCDKPVPLAEWAACMRSLEGAPCTVDFAARWVMMPWERDNEKPGWSKDDLVDAFRWNDEYQAVYDSMMESGFYDHLKSLVAEAEARKSKTA